LVVSFADDFYFAALGLSDDRAIVNRGDCGQQTLCVAGEPGCGSVQAAPCVEFQQLLAMRADTVCCNLSVPFYA